MKSPRSVPQAALVIKWPQSVAAAAARDVARRLMATRVTATWSLDQASQVEALASWGSARNGEAALIVPAIAPSEGNAAEGAASRELARRLELLRSTGTRVDAVQAGPELLGGHWPRTLRALGVHGVVVERSREPGAARALPFGVWQFTPQATAPRVRRWNNWFKARRPMFAAVHGAPTLVTIDLARVGTAGARAWREMEATLEQAADAIRASAIALVTMGELTAQFTQASAPRPQRSILRAA